MKKPSKKKLLEVAQASCGIKTHAGQMCDVDRKTIRRWMDSTPYFKEAMDEGRDNFVDLGEMGLAKAVKAGDVKACIYITSTLGKRRGYTQLVETRDRSEFEDQLNDMDTEDLIDLLERTSTRIENG